MNRALWRKAIADAWLQLVLSAVLLVLFAWIFVWLTNLFQPKAFVAVLKLLPNFVEPLVGVPLDRLATTTGRLSVLFLHVITLLVVIGWAVGRGSDVVSGEINRGTMDLLLVLPIRRATLIFSSAVVTAAGAVVLAFSLCAGCWIGIQTVPLADVPELRQFVPGAWNLAAMTFCLAGLTTLFSSCDHSRWRSMVLAGALFAVSSILRMVARLWTHGEWLKYLSFLSAFEPQRLILLPGEVTGPLAWWYNGTLLAIGLAAYGLAMVVFTYRDIPAAR